jgi:ParB family transcriptional regulator, chromosome partitioning protein
MSKAKANQLKELLSSESVPHPVHRIDVATNPATGAPHLVEAKGDGAAAAKQRDADDPKPRPAAPSWSLNVSGGAIGAVGASISKAQQEQVSIIDNLKQQLAAGETIVEIDTTNIEDSFVSDRMDISDEETSILSQQIKDQGQIVPILVRPHPSKQGFYQVAYGHRRVRATAMLGIKVRAIVRDLTDKELVIAQGQENNARQDLSFIEKATFAVKLEERGFDRKTICSALAVSKSDCSTLIKIGSRIPRAVIEAIGKAPGVGRPRWNELFDKIQEKGNVDRCSTIISDSKFLALGSDERFAFLLQKLSKKEDALSVPRDQTFWNDAAGRRLAVIQMTESRCTLQIDRRDEPGFAKFVIERLNDLYRDYEAAKSSGAS